MDSFIVYGLVLYAVLCISSIAALVAFEWYKVIDVVLFSLLCTASSVTLGFVIMHTGIGATDIGRLTATLILIICAISQIFLGRLALERFGPMARLKKQYMLQTGAKD